MRSVYAANYPPSLIREDVMILGDDEAKLSHGGTNSESSLSGQVICTEIFNCLEYKAGMHSWAVSAIEKADI